MKKDDTMMILEWVAKAKYPYYIDNNRNIEDIFQPRGFNCEDKRITKMRQHQMTIERLKRQELKRNESKNHEFLSDAIADLHRKMIDAFVDAHFDFAKDYITREEAERFVIHNIDFSDIRLIEKDGKAFVEFQPKLRDMIYTEGDE